MKKRYIIPIIIGLLLGFFIYVLLLEEPDVNQTSASIPAVSAGESILADGKTGEILYEKRSAEKAYPASTTKIMTALVALNICKDLGANLDQQVVIPKEGTNIEGSSLYLKAGEKITIRELLYGMMLRSGNDAATTIAITLGGTLENFVDKMNETAKELGLRNTHFMNPTGLFDEEHYTTAEDLCKISQIAMRNRNFRKIVRAKSWKNYSNKNKTVYQYDGATGIKIGFTKKSGRTLVASAKRQDVELICVVLSDGDWFNDAYRLMDYGFEMMGCEKNGDEK